MGLQDRDIVASRNARAPVVNPSLARFKPRPVPNETVQLLKNAQRNATSSGASAGAARTDYLTNYGNQYRAGQIDIRGNSLLADPYGDGSGGARGTGGGSSGGYTGGVPPVGGGGGVGTELDRLRQERLEAALKAIGAQFDSEEGNLKAQILDLMNQFNVGSARNARDSRYLTEDLNNAAAERGIFHSGLHTQRLARGLSPLADQMQDLVGQLNPSVLQGMTPEELFAMPTEELTAFLQDSSLGTGMRTLLSAIIMLGQQEQSAITGAKLGAEQDELDISKLIEMINAGLTG